MLRTPIWRCQKKKRTKLNSEKVKQFQSGANLNGLGKIELTIKEKTVEAINYELIDLNVYSDLKSVIDDYNDLPNLNEIIRYTYLQHNGTQVFLYGCFKRSDEC